MLMTLARQNDDNAGRAVRAGSPHAIDRGPAEPRIVGEEAVDPAGQVAANLLDGTRRVALVGTALATGSGRKETALSATECDAVYEWWREGTVRGAMALGCEIRVTKARTMTIWRNWLTYPDRSPPLLPEPNNDD